MGSFSYHWFGSYSPKGVKRKHNLKIWYTSKIEINTIILNKKLIIIIFRAPKQNNYKVNWIDSYVIWDFSKKNNLPLLDLSICGRISMEQVSLNEVITNILTPYCNHKPKYKLSAKQACPSISSQVMHERCKFSCTFLMTV